MQEEFFIATTNEWKVKLVPKSREIFIQENFVNKISAKVMIMRVC